MSGTVNIARSIFDHAVFADEPKTEREAWVWLIMKASWKARAYRVGNVVVSTDRGQLAASVRYLAAEWQWTAPKVQRYLKRLEKMEMIRSQADTGVTVITICNYDEYQSQYKASDTDAIQSRYRTDTRQKKDEIREEGNKKDADASMADVADPDPASPSFDDFWAVWPLGKISKKDAEKAFRKLSPQDQRLATERSRPWAEQWRRSHPHASPIHPATYLNAGRFNDEIQPSLTIINGSHHDRQSPQQNRQSAADDRFGRIADAAVRNRAPSRPDFGFG